MLKNFDSITKEIQSHLVDYLEERGIDTRKNFSCINPKHDDSNPSASLLPGGNRIFCHGCSARYDIFDVARIMEDKPLHGIQFVTDTVQYLANKYNIVVETEELSEEKVQQLALYRVCRIASEFITNQTSPPNKLVSKEIARRKWSTKTLLETNTGYVPSYESFITHLTDSGYTIEFLTDCDMTRSDIFNENNIIFTQCDEWGHPVGFAARNLLFNKEDPTSGSKYVNQRTTSIFQKGKRLYGFNLARETEGPIYLFEGQGDVLTAREYGIHNCCGIGSTALSTDHILLLKEHNKLHIILCLDNDEAGQTKTEKLLDTKLAGHKDIRVSIVLIPNGKDPDEFIRTNGVTEFRKLAHWSAFEWRLDRFKTDNGTDLMDVARAMIPFIINEPSALNQEDMAKVLARVTGYSLKAIESEVARLMDAQEERKASERMVVLERALQEAKDNPESAESVLTSARDKLFEISKKYDEDYMSADAYLREITSQRTLEENRDDKFAGFILGPDLQNFQDALSGEWNQDVLMVFGGAPNAGKSAFLLRLGYGIASHQQENDALVIYHTIDDTTEQLVPRLVTIAEGSRHLTINQVRAPAYWSKKEGQDILYRRKVGYDLIENLVRNGRFIMKDANHGTTLAYVETLINYYQERYPSRKIVYFLDNFHKLSDYPELASEERIRFKKLSKAIKGLATRYHIPILCTMEYTKLQPGTKPTNQSIAESRAMEYDANFIAHIWNELHELGPNASIFHTDINGTRLPRIEMIIGKNKISSFKSSLYFDFYPASSDFVGIDESIIASQMQEAREAREENMRRTGKNKPGSLYDN